MFEGFLTIGFAMIIVAMMLAVIRNGRRNRRPKTSQRKQVAENSVQNLFDEPWELNFDAFSDPELAVNPKSDEDSQIALVLSDENETSNNLQKKQEKPALPLMTLASLVEIQNEEAARAAAVAAPIRPRILGDSACELGVRYFEHLLAHHVMPRGACALTNDSNILIAKNALKTSHSSATLSHGAVAQRIGERAVCLFEPLETPVGNLGKALEQIAEILENKTIFVILAPIDHASDEALAHLGPLCARYHIPKTNVYIEQPNGDFINYVEDARGFVPSRIDAMNMPQAFFAKIFDYAQQAYDENDCEAVVRTLEPLLDALCMRIRAKRDFPEITVAQALNLMGMARRDMNDDDKAVEYFDRSLAILKKIEDYEAIKSVKANLGITLALSHPLTLPKIELAIRHLNEVTQLNPRDDEAWLYLANSYLEQYRFTNAKSLLGRALRAYNKAYELAPTDDIASCIDALQRQIGMASASAQSLVSNSTGRNQRYRNE